MGVQEGVSEEDRPIGAGGCAGGISHISQGDRTSIKLSQEPQYDLTGLFEDQTKLIKPYQFTVAHCKTITFPTTSSNEIMGPGHQSYISGCLVSTEIKVEEPTIFSQTGIESLIFKGATSLRRGDVIRAYLHPYTELEGNSNGVICNGEMGHYLYYEPRALQKIEQASRIEVLGRNNVYAEFVSEFPIELQKGFMSSRTKR
jgi:hypothetical protein